MMAQTPSAASPFRDRGQAFLELSRAADAEIAFSCWVTFEPNNADAHYHLGLSRALQGRALDARSAFAQTLILAPGRADAYFEIAAGYLGAKEFADALRWVSKGLALAPADPFGLELAGTIGFLNGEKVWALRFFNRLNRPHLNSLQISSPDSVDRQRIADTISLAPGELLDWAVIERSRLRLEQYRYLRNVAFEPIPGASPDSYDLRVSVDSRSGFGSPSEVLLGGISGVGARTLHLAYWNIAGTGMTADARYRWPREARLGQFAVDIPGFMHTSALLGASVAWRSETWAPSDASHGFLIQRTDAQMSVVLELPPTGWATEIGAGERRRRFSLTGSQETAGGESDFRDGYDSGVTRVVSLRVAPRMKLAESRTTGEWHLQSNLTARLEGGRAFGTISHLFGRASATGEVGIRSESRAGRHPVLAVAASTGATSPWTLAEDNFVLAQAEGDNFHLRAHPFLERGHVGAALASRFVLLNATAGIDLVSWRGITVSTVAFLDCAEAKGVARGDKPPRGFLDGGLGFEFGSAWSRGTTLSVVWARDWMAGRNTVLVGASIR